jgi:TonB family protein
MPAIIQFKVAKTEAPPPPPVDEQPVEQPKKKARKRPTVRKRAASRAKVAARPQLNLGVSATSLLPTGGGMAVDLDFNPGDIDIDSAAMQDKDVIARARRHQRREFAKRASRQGGLAAISALKHFTKPRLINHVEPVYPEEAKKNKTEGHVVVRILISMVGSVEEVEIIASKPDGYFDESVVDALAGWTFSPAKDEEGNPVEFWDRYRLEFKLENAR